MVSGKMPMENIDLIQSEIDRVKNNQNELYALDRKKAEVMASIQTDLAEIKVKNQNMENDIAELKTDISDLKKTAATKEDVAEIKADVQEIKATINSRKWQAKDKVAIITAFISLVGVIAVALINK